MSRSEWWTLVLLGGLCDFVLILILVYLRFMWDLQCKQWDMLWRNYVDTSLHLGDLEVREHRQSAGRVLGGSRSDIPENLRDAFKRSPGVR
jgi:hypothetical protein